MAPGTSTTLILEFYNNYNYEGGPCDTVTWYVVYDSCPPQFTWSAVKTARAQFTITLNALSSATLGTYNLWFSVKWTGSENLSGANF